MARKLPALVSVLVALCISTTALGQLTISIPGGGQPLPKYFSGTLNQAGGILKVNTFTRYVIWGEAVSGE